jgi:nucleoside-diphosphate-sugar epimerase
MASLHGKLLVIFGCGYVGSAVARAAATAGAHVTALTRNPEKAAALQASGVAEVVVADLAKDDWHPKIPAGAELVVNCVSTGGGGLASYRHTYVEGMASVLRWVATGSRPVDTLVYTSSTSVYPQDGGATVDETADTTEASPGGRILREAEEMLRMAPLRSRSFVFRLAGIYGPGRHHLLDQLRAGATNVSGGFHRLNLAHRDDIASAIIAGLTAPDGVRGGVFNVADGAPGRREEVIRWLAVRLGRPVPHFMAGTGGTRRGGEAAPDRIISSAKLQTTLGWQPRYPDFRSGYESILRGSSSATTD